MDYILKKDTILYSGNSGKRQILTLYDIFNYIGQRGEIEIIGEPILYVSTDYNTARGYALSCLTNGFVHQFRVNKDVQLTISDVYIEAEEIAETICPESRGVIIRYGDKDEMGLCSASNFLEYDQTQNCKTGEWYNILDRITASDIVYEEIP